MLTSARSRAELRISTVASGRRAIKYRTPSENFNGHFPAFASGYVTIRAKTIYGISAIIVIRLPP